MERYFKRKLPHESTESSSSAKENAKISTHACLEDLPADPGLRIRIRDSFQPSVRDQVRREYLKKGPFQPRNHLFPAKNINGNSRRFISAWFDEFPTWLEYSIEKDAAFCLCCYLFKPNTGEQSGSDCFVSRGFSNWKRKERLLGHVGGHNSAHKQAWSNCEALLKQNQERKDYKTLLGASIACTRYLLSQGFIFCGEYEFADPNNEGDFLEFFKFLCVRNEELKAVTLRSAPLKLKLTSPDTQKDIIVATSVEIINAIARDG